MAAISMLSFFDGMPTYKVGFISCPFDTSLSELGLRPGFEKPLDFHRVLAQTQPPAKTPVREKT